MSMIRTVLHALIAVSVLAFNNVSHAETQGLEGQQKDLVAEVATQTRSTLSSFFQKLLTPQAFAREIECLARNIFHEAGSEPTEGKVAVGLVTLNRLEDGRFGSSVCKVVHQPYQFSWVSMKLRKPAEHDPRWVESRRIAEELASDQNAYSYLRMKYEEALYFHATYVKPSWSKTKRRVGSIGGHHFYEDRNRNPSISF